MGIKYKTKMDYLTTNWRDKMQTNPVANMILNNPRNKIGYITKVRGLTQLPANRDVVARDFVEYHGDPQIALISDRSGVIPINDPLFTIAKEHYPTQTELLNAINRLRRANAGRNWNDYAEEKYKEGQWIEISDVWGKKQMWNKTFVNDYINIDHPKRRVHLIDAIANKPLQIKPPSVFFSDV